MGKSKRWSLFEDKSLCRAWLIVSQDPVVGDGQTVTTFWGKINTTFQNLIKIPEDEKPRSIKAMKTRWAQINHNVQKFAGCLKIIFSKNASGKTKDDQIADAEDFYFERYNSRFLFTSCWELLKSAPKWCDYTTIKKEKKKAVKRKILEVEELGKCGKFWNLFFGFAFKIETFFFIFSFLISLF